MTVQALATQIRASLCGLTSEQAEELARAVDRVVAELRPERIYAFGSHARGDATAESDVDLFVVVPDTDVPMHRQAHSAYVAVGPHLLPLDILVMTRSEFERRLPALASLPATVVREGRLLYAA